LSQSSDMQLIERYIKNKLCVLLSPPGDIFPSFPDTF